MTKSENGPNADSAANRSASIAFDTWERPSEEPTWITWKPFEPATSATYADNEPSEPRARRVS